MTPPRGKFRVLDSTLFWTVLVLGVFAANAIWCLRNRVAPDVAWYLYATARIHDGAVLYRDIHDMNLPIVYLLHMPLAWLNGLTGLRLDVLLYAAIWSVVAAAILLTRRIPGVTAAGRGFLMLATAFAALSLNRLQLGQRDPVCGFLFTGLVVSVYLRRRGEPSPSLFVFAASLGMAMKPHFLIPWAFLIAALASEIGLRRAIRMKEAWLPPAISVLSWIVTVTAFPAFLDMLATASRYYSNMNVSPYEFSPLLVPLIPALIALLSGKVAPRPFSWFTAWATVGFAIECILQRKGFLYHQAPCMFWGFITAGLLLIERQSRTEAKRPRLLIPTASFILVIYSFWSAILPAPRHLARTGLDDFVAQHARGSTVLTLSTDLRTGFPLILEAGAFNARHDAQLWTIGGLYRDQVAGAEASPTPVPARYHALAEMSRDERESFDEVVAIVTEKHPEIILVQTSPSKWGLDNLQFDFLDYFSMDPRFREALQSYKRGPSNDQRLVLTLEPQTRMSAHAVF